MSHSILGWLRWHSSLLGRSRCIIPLDMAVATNSRLWRVCRGLWAFHIILIQWPLFWASSSLKSEYSRLHNNLEDFSLFRVLPPSPGGRSTLSPSTGIVQSVGPLLILGVSNNLSRKSLYPTFQNAACYLKVSPVTCQCNVARRLGIHIFTSYLWSRLDQDQAGANQPGPMIWN